MSLQFIMGPSGSGKSHYLYQKVIEESRRHPEKNYFVIVPEQFTMQTQKDLVLAHPHKGILNVDVLSFNRLAYRIFEETGMMQQAVLSDVGKNFVLRKIAADYEEELKILGGNLKKTGFISEVKSVISEFTQYDVTEDTLERLRMEVGEQTNFAYKLREIQTIYHGFREYLSEKYITGEELLDVLERAVPKSKILKDSVIVFDGFTGFTPVQNKLLSALLLSCEQMMVTVTLSPHRKNHPLFELSDKMINSLTGIAKACAVEVLTPVQLFDQPAYRFRENAPLAFLEENLFRYTKKQYDEEQDRILIYRGKQSKEELDFVAQSIRRLVRTRNLRYRDIAVIASDMSLYANYAEKAFLDYEIPYFMDHKRSILLNSFVEFLRSLVAMAQQRFTYESVFRYLRTGLTAFTMDEIDILENYCVAMGIRGYRQWNETWIRRMHDMDEQQLAMINEIRARFVDSIANVMEVLKRRNKTVADITRALHIFFMEQEVQQSVKACETRFVETGEHALGKEYAQIYRIVIDLFDQFVELLGDETISLQEYCELLDAGLEEAKVGIIPPSVDSVTVGDIERTRIKDAKVVFFVGVNDSHIPGSAKAGGLLSEHDRERFAAGNVALAPGPKEKAFMQKFYLYMLLTKPSEQIILTYNREGSAGKDARPAYLVNDLLKLFPKLSVREIASDLETCEMTPKSGIRQLIDGLQHRESGLSEGWQELYSWYKGNLQWASRLEQIVEAAFYRKPNEMLSKEMAKVLYGEVLSNSVSRLERFSACAYAHFLTYGLRLRERQVHQLQSFDVGNILHTAMEYYANRLEQAGESWVSISEQKRASLIDRCVEDAVSNNENMVLYSNARNEYTITRLKNMMERTVWALTKQLEQGDFVPVGYEIVYQSEEIPLEGENRMKIRGKVDRVDLCEAGDERYVKVIDYKSGKKVFDLGELYHGLQMQLVVYLNYVIKREAMRHPDKHIVPAGMFYCQIHNPLLPRQATDTQQEDALLAAFCPEGVVSSERRVIEHLEHGLTEKSKYIPLQINKNGFPSAKSKVLSEEDFALVQKFAERKMKEIGNEILEGKIEAVPYKKGDRTGCGFCAYKGVCGFDEKLGDYTYREIAQDSMQEVLACMRKEAAEWE